MSIIFYIIAFSLYIQVNITEQTYTVQLFPIMNLLSFFPVNHNYSMACFLIKNIHKAVINKSFLTSGTSL